MIEKVLKYVKEQHMLEAGDCVVTGVSGGADSICLFYMLLEIRKVIPIEIRVVHVNHLIRSDAAEDAAYVQNMCAMHEIPFTLVEKDVEALAGRLHISTEEAGRNVRYEAFYRELGTGKGKIAVAHNKNDCCETFLFNLFRGSSLKGLAGIRPVRDRIIRPLMCVERAEIEQFLQERTIHYCIDSTNLEDNYTRNRIRHHILETAVKEISPAAVNHISNACERVSEAYDLIEDVTKQGYESCVKRTTSGYHIDEAAFKRLHKTIRGYVLMEVLSRAAGSSRDLETVHIRQLEALMENQCGRLIKLPYRLCARRDYTGICIFREDARAQKNQVPQEVALPADVHTRLLAGEVVVLALNAHQRFKLEIVPRRKFGSDLQNIPQKKYTKWIDYDKIKDNVVVRTRKSGDYLTINASNQRKSLKTYLIDNKIPQEKRSRIWLVADGSHVIWIIGERISSYYKVSEGTERILKLAFIDDKTEQ